MATVYDFIQTFYVDPEAVDNAGSVMLTNVELFFRAKPSDALSAGTENPDNLSGASIPGVSIAICRTVGDEPIGDYTGIMRGTTVRLDSNSINVTNNATVGTVFRFANPIYLETGKSYGIVVTFEDKGFELWTNINGLNLISESGLTSTPSPGPGTNFRGLLYEATKSVGTEAVVNNVESVSRTGYKPLADRDLKFKVTIAKFRLPDNKKLTVNVVNKDYEFFTISNRTGTFRGGEVVYKDVANSAGTVAFNTTSLEILGTGTAFTNITVGQSIVIRQGNVTNVLRVANIVNDQLLEVDVYPTITGSGGFKVPPIGRVHYANYLNNKLVLVDSSATNSTFLFQSSNNIVGAISGAQATIASIDKHSVDKFTPRFKIVNPTFADVSVKYQYAQDALSGGTYMYPSLNNMKLDVENEVTDYDAFVYSRSFEVAAASGEFGLADSKKSAVANITFTYDTNKNYTFTAPFVAEELDLFTFQNQISNTISYLGTTTDRDAVSYQYDTETSKNGSALSKHITKRISFAPNRAAEDLVVYLSAFRPAGTDIRVYAKFHNSLDSEAFDDKMWTPLELKDNVEKFSVSDTDIIEYTFGIPKYSDTIKTLTGRFSTTLGSKTITTTADHSTTLAANDVILLQDSLVPGNYGVYAVESVTASTIVVTKPINDNNLVSSSASGFLTISTLKHPRTAFINPNNDNIMGYFSSTTVEFEKYNSMQIKIVLLADNTYTIPKVEAIQAIGVSA